VRVEEEVKVKGEVRVGEEVRREEGGEGEREERVRR